MGALALRSSLEASNRGDAGDRARRLLPWLSEMGCLDELDPIERRELATPLGELSQSEMIDVHWAGENAAFFSWMLKLHEPLSETSPADQAVLPVLLHVLKSDARKIIEGAALHDRKEIEETCVHIVLIRSLLQELRIKPPARDILRRVNLERLLKVGQTVSDGALARASRSIERMTAQEREAAAGIYFIRDHAALWFLGNSDTYYE